MTAADLYRYAGSVGLAVIVVLTIGLALAAAGRPDQAAEAATREAGSEQ